jgi:hypothetical protein
MKKIIFTSLILTTALLSKADMKLVDEYIKVSGIKEIIISLPKNLEKGYLKNTKKRKQNIVKSLEFEPTLNYVKMRISDELSNSILKDSIKFYTTPLGEKFKNQGLSIVSKTPKQKSELFYKNIKTYPPSYERLDVVNKFTNRLELAPISVHIIGEFLGRINAKVATSKRPNLLLKQAAVDIKEYIYQNALYAYGNFSNKELQETTKYFNTNAGRFEHMVVSRIFKKLISDSFIDVATN